MEPTAETYRCSMDTLADDMQRHVQEFLEGADCCRAGGAIKRWRALQDERWWHLKTKLDFCVGRWDANDEPSWRAVYARCRVGPSAARWAAAARALARLLHLAAGAGPCRWLPPRGLSLLHALIPLATDRTLGYLPATGCTTMHQSLAPRSCSGTRAKCVSECT